MLRGPSGGEESVGKWAWVLVLAMGAFILAGGEGALGLPPSQGPVKDYAYRNGKVIIGGDVVVPCRSFASAEFYPSDATDEAQAQAERVLEQCEQAGHGALPRTGGGSSALLAAGVLLVCAGLGLVSIHRST